MFILILCLTFFHLLELPNHLYAFSFYFDMLFIHNNYVHFTLARWVLFENRPALYFCNYKKKKTMHVYWIPYLLMIL